MPLTAWALIAACSLPAVPERWSERGFESEAECWLNHGWDGSINDGFERHEFFDFWCGPITD